MAHYIQRMKYVIHKLYGIKCAFGQLDCLKGLFLSFILSEIGSRIVPSLMIWLVGYVMIGDVHNKLQTLDSVVVWNWKKFSFNMIVVYYLFRSCKKYNIHWHTCNCGTNVNVTCIHRHRLFLWQYWLKEMLIRFINLIPQKSSWILTLVLFLFTHVTVFCVFCPRTLAKFQKIEKGLIALKNYKPYCALLAAIIRAISASHIN